MLDDMTIPECLKRKGPVKPARLPKWKKPAKRAKPEGERYEDAEQWELFIESSEHFLPKLACGLRRVWVADHEDGSRRIWISDGESEQSLSMSEWARISARARRLA